MSDTRRNFWLFAACATAAISASEYAAAQDVSSDIVVTATRRESALQDVPVAVTPVTAALIQNAGIRDMQDLANVAPSLQFNVSENETSATARLRGVGTQGSNPGLESAVGIFVDGVYRARNGVALTDLGEMSQIEVLRGPQGTLFGRNTSAGLISVRTAGPDMTKFGAELEATYGNYEETRIAGHVTGPVVEDVLGLRLFAARSTRDGLVDVSNAAGAQTESNDRDLWTVRGQALFTPSDNIDFRLIADYTERDELCCAASHYSPSTVNGVAGPFPVSGNGPIGGASAQQAILSVFGGFGTPIAGAFPPGLGTAAAIGALNSRLGGGDLQERIAFANQPYAQMLEDWGVSGELNWDLPIGTLTSVTAYRDWQYDQGQDSDFTSADLWGRAADGGAGFGFEIFTQELRLTGQAGALDWLVGAFYSDETLTRDDNLSAGTQFGPYFATLGAALAASFNGANPFAQLGAVPAGSGVTDFYEQEGKSWALFTHNIFAMDDRTDLTIGLRYTNESKDLNARFATDFNSAPLLTAQVAALEPALGLPGGTLAGFANCDPALQPGSAQLAAVIATVRSAYCNPILRTELDGATRAQSRDEEEWSGVISARREFTDNISGYVSISRGYKGGGFNLDRNYGFVSTPGAQYDTSFAAETVDAYELGAKTNWMDGALILNLAAYFNEYKDFQLNTFNGISFQVTSVPEVVSQGVELDAIWRMPIDGLSFQGGVAYTEAEYGKDDGWVRASANPVTGALVNGRLPNARLTNAPLWTTTGSFTYERPVFNDAAMALFYIDARYVSDQNTGSNLDPAKIQQAYTLVNARFGLSTADERYAIEFWGRNLTDEDYYQIAFDVPLQTGSYGAFWGDPLTYGVTLRARY
ncbi:MAG: TonB-dependent receptor plug domain-containing protein [Alphaproteobacteria bacterium]|nr:TonB-dependent receptor plug domain-containing protein [Alphaproteobacteria bacterium]